MQIFVSGYNTLDVQVFATFEVSRPERAGDTNFSSFCDVLRKKYPEATTLVISFCWEDEIKKVN